MGDLRYVLLRRFLRGRAERIHDERRIPSPAIDGHVDTGGPDADRILLVGNGILGGIGVEDHADSMVGHVATELSRRTGHPADVTVLADVHLRCRDLPGFIHGHDLSVFDAVVVLAGASDAYELLPEDQWRRDMRALLQSLDVQIPTMVDVLVVGINPPSSIPVLHLHAGCPADERAAAMNAITKRLSKGRFRYVPPPAVGAIGPRSRHPTPEDTELVSQSYLGWSSEIATHLEYVRDLNKTWTS